MFGARRSATFDEVEYAPGRKFRVIKEGARLSGMVPSGPSQWSGGGGVLEVGTIIVCRGYGAGWGSDPGMGVEWEAPEGAERMQHVDFYPQAGGAFNYRPMPGYLEPVDG